MAHALVDRVHLPLQLVRGKFSGAVRGGTNEPAPGLSRGTIGAAAATGGWPEDDHV